MKNWNSHTCISNIKNQKNKLLTHHRIALGEESRYHHKFECQLVTAITV